MRDAPVHIPINDLRNLGARLGAIPAVKVPMHTQMNATPVVFVNYLIDVAESGRQQRPELILKIVYRSPVQLIGDERRKPGQATRFAMRLLAFSTNQLQRSKAGRAEGRVTGRVRWKIGREAGIRIG